MVIEFLGIGRGRVHVILPSPIGGDMLIAVGLEYAGIGMSGATVGRLHLQKEPGPPRTGDMEGDEAVLIAALYAGTHLLATDIACLK